MKTYNLKSVVRRGSMLVAAFVVAGAAILPATSASADALNPLTDRSLTLSSGSPGWAFTDGSGNATYAPPNSGSNGQKTGNTFSFKVSSDTTGNSADYVRSMTFQYCTASAGNCMGPGDNGWGGTTAPTAARVNNSATTIAAETSDLEVVLSSPSQIESGDFANYVNANTGEVEDIPAPNSTGDNFLVYYRTSDNGTPANMADDTWASSDGWSMIAEEAQFGTEANQESTGTNNQIKLTNATGQGFEAGQMVKVVFFGTDTNYITNPGSDEFFVKINTYNSDTVWDDTTLVDGGVTVANVMNESIQITTKVLETMDFSVGTVDPFTLEADTTTASEFYAATGRTTHMPCEPILKGMTPAAAQNTLQLGDVDAEFSLETSRTYSTHSYWRLSSNSSAGATVYYSGVTLSNTVGDKIDPIYRTTPNDGLSAAPQLGMEQFGLALANGDGSDVDAPNAVGYAVDYTVERGGTKDLENAEDNTTAGIHASVTDDGVSNLDANASYHAPQLYPLIPTSNYGDGAGVINANYAAPGTPIDTSFAFDEQSNSVPVAVATQDSQVVDCVTGKMRYIANIAATTPAGIYTTKINYIAAPQY